MFLLIRKSMIFREILYLDILRYIIYFSNCLTAKSLCNLLITKTLT